MRVLFTADWQTAWYNLDQVNRTVSHILSLCDKHGIKVVVHCGDVKQQLNPVDIRVTNYMVSVIQTFKKRGIRLVFLLGNHDRVGMFDTAENWFPTLEAAGAETVDTPSLLQAGKYRFYMLPFMDNNKVVQHAKEFTKSADPENSILVFHAELDRCMFNVLTKAIDGIRVKQLYPSSYMFVIGGHMHMPQQLRSNVFYVGSPFCEDWGEANQHKRFLIADLKRKTIRSVPCRVPGMYDPTWPGFAPPSKWKGALVRVHVPYGDGVADLTAFLDRAKKRAEKEYPGAAIVVNPEYVDDKGTVVSVDGRGSDKEIIETYIYQHCPTHLSKLRAAIASYLLYKLSEVGSIRRSTEQIKLMRARVRNVLSFKKATVDYTKPGITVVTGTNEDWRSRSNGSGKTSFLQFPAIAFCGRTLKGQKHNKWMRNGLGKEECWVEHEFQLADGRMCKIIRGRKPKKLQLLIDGKDWSTGFGTNDTQKVIEIVTGFTWESLKNVLYIDQAEVNEILSGGDAKRKEIFNNFLNLERFGKARELVRKDATAVNKNIVEANHGQDMLHQEKNHIYLLLKQLKLSGNAKQEYRQAKKAYIKARESYSSSKRVDRSDDILKASENVSKRELDVAVLTADIEAAEESIEQMSSLKAKCPTCKQRVTKEYIQKHVKPYQRKVNKLTKKRKTVEVIVRGLEDRLSDIREEQRDGEDKWYAAREKLFKAKTVMEAAQRRWEEAQKIIKLRKRYKRRMHYLKQSVRHAQEYLHQLRRHQEFLEYAQAVLGKDGVPSFMAMQLCPALNKAAEKYSQLFTEGEIHVKFEMTADKDIDVSVQNLHGGEDLVDQSQGEKRMASIITSFALRDVLSPCNVLILDEPGESLDQFNATVFARALKEVSKRFGTILLTTHNPHILAELSEERHIAVVKRNRVSRLV